VPHPALRFSHRQQSFFSIDTARASAGRFAVSIEKIAFLSAGLPLRSGALSQLKSIFRFKFIYFCHQQF
jgi:hypothetical protein